MKLGKYFFNILEIGTKKEKNFGKDFNILNFLLEIDRRMRQNFGKELLFWRKNGTKLLEPTLSFLYRTVALFTGHQNFRNQKNFHIVHKNDNSNVSVMISSASGKKLLLFYQK